MRTDLFSSVPYVEKPWRTQRSDIRMANVEFIRRPCPFCVRLVRSVRLCLWRVFFLPRYRLRAPGRAWF